MDYSGKVVNNILKEDFKPGECKKCGSYVDNLQYSLCGKCYNAKSQLKKYKK